MNYSLNQLYQSIGISKQAVNQYQKRQDAFTEKVSHLMLEAQELRKAHPGCGVEKMFYTLKPDFIGRDKFIEVFMSLGFRLEKKRNYRRTTYSGPIHYPNLIEGLKVTGPSQVWQSDITYIRVKETFYYAVFIIDVYTKKIVGYSISDHMRATANIKALKMALKTHAPPTYHHSDRGSQYIYKDYIAILNKHGVKLSMGNIAQENAYAERINGTIKNEFIKLWNPQSYQQLKRQIKKAVAYYNHKRPHDNIDKMSPNEFEKCFSSLTSQRRKTLTIFDYQKSNKPVNSI